MPTPATAPPSVMVLSCGTTAGIAPFSRQARVRSSYVVMPSASTKPSPTPMTWLKARTSRRRRGAPSRSRKSFEGSLARPTGPAPCLSCAARVSLFLLCRLALLLALLFAWLFVEEAPRHRVAGHAEIALREHDLEEMRASRRRAEHLRTAVEVDAPDAAEALVEALRVHRLDAR